MSSPAPNLPAPSSQVTGPVTAVVPLRDGKAGKTRLAGVLSAQDRTRLVAVLARHVVTALTTTDGVARVLVVTADPVFASDALGPVDPRVEIVLQPAARRGLNPAIDVGRELAANPQGRLLVIHADLPGLSPDDVTALLAEAAQVTLAPDRVRGGTNALVLGAGVGAGTGAQQFTFRFGVDSFTAHQAEADRCGLSLAVVERPGTGIDLDTPQDWAALPDEVRRRVLLAVPAMAALG